MVTITIELPEEIVLLSEKDEILKYMIKESLKNIVSKYLLAEELTKDVKVSEEEILEIDSEIKKKAWRELKKKWNLS